MQLRCFSSCLRACYPIYDKYAHIALKVILERMDYKEVVTDKALNREFHNGTKKYLDDYKTYIEKLESIFGKEYATDRRIDQALWAYGHLFSDTKTITRNNYLDWSSSRLHAAPILPHALYYAIIPKEE